MGCNLRNGVTRWAAGPVLAAIVVSTAESATPSNYSLPTTLHENGPPLKHTGGFGEPTCQACHSEFDINTSAGAVGVDGFPSNYVAGERYFISISVMSEDMQSAGFQATIRFAVGPNRGASAGAFEVTDNHVTVRRSAENMVEYLQHTGTGTRVVTNGVATWTTAWTAPQDTTRLVLHVAANDANGDNSPLGDFVYTSDVVANGITSDIQSSQHTR